MLRWFLDGSTQGLNENLRGQFFGNSEPGIAHLANDAGGVTDEPNVLLFAKAHFAQTTADFGRGGEFLDADRATFGNVAQRARGRVGTLSLNHHDFLLFLLRFHRAAG